MGTLKKLLASAVYVVKLTGTVTLMLCVGLVIGLAEIWGAE